MNTRLYEAIPFKIQQLMAFPYVPMGNRNRSGGTFVVNRHQMHLWIPALTEICISSNYPTYENEGSKMSMYVNE
jgi:hypothetical protein